MPSDLPFPYRGSHHNLKPSSRAHRRDLVPNPRSRASSEGWPRPRRSGARRALVQINAESPTSSRALRPGHHKPIRRREASVAGETAGEIGSSRCCRRKLLQIGGRIRARSRRHGQGKGVGALVKRLLHSRSSCLVSCGGGRRRERGTGNAAPWAACVARIEKRRRAALDG